MCLTELTAWGLTILRVRDDYIHGRFEPELFWDQDNVYFYPCLFDRNVRHMPDSFYCAKQSAIGSLKPIYLRKFVVYAAVPVSERAGIESLSYRVVERKVWPIAVLRPLMGW